MLGAGYDGPNHASATRPKIQPNSETMRTPGPSDHIGRVASRTAAVNARRDGESLTRLRDYASHVLGSCQFLADSSWQHQMSAVWRIRDASGTEWFLKRHRDSERYDAEVTAYQNWVPALAGRAPQLRAFDESLHAIILSALPGGPASWPAPQAGKPTAHRASELAIHREAGTILRRLHDAQPAVPWPDFAAARIEQFDRLRRAVSGLLTRRALDAAREEIVALTEVPAPGQVPCHHDYTPRNWLVDNGTLHVIDFEWAGLDAWVADLARLHLSVWTTRPDLREPFLEGYGRQLSDTDRKALHGCAVLTGVWLVSKAHETGQPSFEDASRTAVLRLIGAAL
jgi:Ser/Thr protein kinase RdoA (MazF antagonist)